MKILYIIETLRFGGKERRLLELVKYIRKNTSKEIIVLILDNYIEFDYIARLNVKIVALDRQRDGYLKTFFNVFRQIKIIQPNILHSWGNVATFLVLPAKLLYSIPLINSQVTDAPNKIATLTLFHIMCKINFLVSDYIASNSFAGLRSYGIEARAKSLVIHNGLDMNRFVDLRSDQRVWAKLGMQKEIVITMVASFSKNKDYDNFFKVADLFLKHRDATFNAIGETYKFEFLSNQSKEIIQKHQQIKILGRRNDIEELVSRSKLCILFSTNGEGISNSILEYMALGKPVIASDVPGNREIIDHGVNGYLVDPNKHKSIVELMILLIDDLKMYTSVSNRAEQTINLYFNLESMGASFDELYSICTSKK